MNNQKTPQEDIWLQLAELFFLDTEPTAEDYQHIGRMLIENGWTPEYTFDFIIKYIAPKYAANLGYFIYPAIGEWSGFDREELVNEVNRMIFLRNKYPSWYFLFSDWWMKRILRWLDFEKLEKAMHR